MMMMEIQGKADAVKQEGKTVEQYASELQYLWGELDHYAPLRMETPNDATAVKKWVEDRRVTQFLKGLNPEFENRRAAICHQDSLPSLELPSVLHPLLHSYSIIHGFHSKWSIMV